MHRERMYTVVGVFVLGGLVLLVASAVFIYDTWLRSRSATYVMFFRGSLRGLETAAPVSYRGIKIGEVTRIEITENDKTEAIQIPVYVQFYVNKTFGVHENPIRKMIQKGMVANIASPNFLTGHSSIEIAPEPVNPNYKERYFHKYPIFPTGNKSGKFLSIDQTLEEMEITLKNIQELVQSKEITNAFIAVKAMAQSVEKLAEDREIIQAFSAVRLMAKHVEALASGLDETAPTLFVNFNRSLKQITDTTHSIQNFTDYLARYPESLLRGKK